MADSASPTTAHTAILLPLPSLAHLQNPHIYSQPIRIAIWSTARTIKIVFYDPKQIKPASTSATSWLAGLHPTRNKRDWNVMQRFLGTIYGMAGQEAARVGRMLLVVDVLIDGMMPTKTKINRKVGQISYVDGEDLDDYISGLYVTPPPKSIYETIPPLRQPSVPTGGEAAGDDEDVDMEDIPAKEEVTALGGTFDHLHGGHKILLTMACWIAGKKLIVGLTVDEMLKSKKFAEYLEAWADRQTRLKAFLSLVAPHLEHDIVALSDVCGPTATDASITGLVVSKESIEGGKIIDDTRKKNGLHSLRTYVIDVISSTHDIPNTTTAPAPSAPEPDLPSIIVDHATEASQLKDLKLGSTYIRQWLSKRKAAEEAKPAVDDSSRRKRRKLNSNGDGQPQQKPARDVEPSDKPMRPLSSGYEASSQHQRWTFSRNRLQNMRQKLSEATVKVCKENWEKEAALHAANPEDRPPKLPAAYPSAEDECLLIRFYLTSITGVIAAGGLTTGRPLPAVVEPVAMAYLKRFYLRMSVLEWHPKVIMPVCLFLAGKVCNFVFDIDHYVSVFDKLQKQDILGIEYLVLQTLRFDMYVQRTDDALHGWYLKLQELPGVEYGQVYAAWSAAKEYLARARLTDVELIYAPSQIAAACFRLADSELFDKLLNVLFTSAGANGNGHTDVDMDIKEGIKQDGTNGKADEAAQLDRDGLVRKIEEIQRDIEAMPSGGGFDMKQVKAVDKLVRGAQDPAKNKASKLYKQRELDHQAEKAKKRALKMAKVKKEMDDRDLMFGPQVNKGTNKLGNGDGKGTGLMGETGMGIQAESGGMMFGGEGLRDVGMELDSSDSDD